jgi:hypothetical protein
MAHQEENPTIILALDAGGEGTKFIYANANQLQAATSCYMEPQMVKLPHSAIAQLQGNKISVALPENMCWVGVEQEFYAVGYLACSRFKGSKALSKSKVETAIYKALGAIWVIKRKLKLGAKFTLDVAVVLPPCELSDKSYFEEQLRQQARRFTTPDGEMSVNINKFLCFPEGSGTFLLYKGQSSAAQIHQEDIALVMLGYRNASVLVSRRGLLDIVASCELGMYQAINQIVKRSSNQSENRLVSAVAKAGWDVKREFLSNLVNTTNPNRKSYELDLLTTAITESRVEYFFQLKTWLDEMIPKEANLIIFCGGTAEYLRQPLKKAFSERCLFHGGVQIPSQLDTGGLGCRLLDIYGVYTFLSQHSLQEKIGR